MKPSKVQKERAILAWKRCMVWTATGSTSGGIGLHTNRMDRIARESIDALDWPDDGRSASTIGHQLAVSQHNECGGDRFDEDRLREVPMPVYPFNIGGGYIDARVGP